MFSGVTATGQYAWAPSSGAVGANEVDLGTSNVGLEGADLEEGSGDSEENVNEYFENHTSRGVAGVHMSTGSNTKSSGKRKERSHPELRARKKKSSGSIGAQLVSIQQQLLDSMSSRSDSTSANRDLPGCNIHEVLAEFQSIPGSTNDDDFLTKLLRSRVCEEIENCGLTSTVLKENIVGFNETSHAKKTLNYNAMNLFACLFFIFIFLWAVT